MKCYWKSLPISLPLCSGFIDQPQTLFTVDCLWLNTVGSSWVVGTMFTWRAVDIDVLQVQWAEGECEGTGRSPTACTQHNVGVFIFILCLLPFLMPGFGSNPIKLWLHSFGYIVVCCTEQRNPQGLCPWTLTVSHQRHGTGVNGHNLYRFLCVAHFM